MSATLSINVTAAIQRLWLTALADAGIEDVVEAILHVFDGLPRPGASGATAIEPGACAWEIAGAEGFDFVHEQQMRSFENTAIYEVLTFDGYTDRAQLAVLRHELEHVRQYRQSMYLLRASTAIRVGLTTNLRDHRTIVGSLYIAMPTERAADQAGRRLAVAKFGAAPDSERGANHDVLLLFGRDDGPAGAELAWRMVANLMFLPTYSGQAAIKCFDIPFEDAGRAVLALAELMWPGKGGSFASALAGDSGFQQARRRLDAGMEAARAISEPSVVRETLRRLVLEAETAAGDVASVTAAAD
jgi:hypothetical protein